MHRGDRVVAFFVVSEMEKRRRNFRHRGVYGLAALFLRRAAAPDHHDGYGAESELIGLVPLAAGQLGPIYASALAAATLLWGWPTVSLVRTVSRESAWLAYKTSGLFLLLLFLGALVDRLARPL